MYNQRDIVLIPIPFSDLTSNKRRPVVIISNDDYNKRSSGIVVVALTSNLAFENSYSIDVDDYNLEAGAFPHKSRLRCDKIYTLSKNMVVKKFNTPNNETFALIKQKISSLISDKNESK